ncbi:MAG: glycosyltransferase [Ginsengibacter sp.]
MKILHYINNLGSGGAEKLLTDILPLMRERGNEVHLIFANDQKNVQGYSKTIEDGGVKITNFNTSFYNPFQTIKLIRILRKEKYDIVHAHLFPSQNWLAIASVFVSSKTILIKTEHNVSNNRRKYYLLKIVERYLYRKYSLIIAITKEVKDSLQNWLKSNVSISIIPNGVNLTQIREVRKNVLISDYLFLQSSSFNILMVGRFNGAKDQDTLIEAIKLLPEKYNVYFAGEGELMEKSKELSKKLLIEKRVHFLGLRTDVYALMNLVDLNVLSSDFEGLSGVTLESLASGKPFIGADVPGINSIVPSADFLFPKRNPALLANKITQVDEDKNFAQKLILDASNHIEKFDIKNMVDKYLESYTQCLYK